MSKNTTPRRIALALALLALSTSELTFANPGYLGAQYLEQQTGFIPDASELGDVFGAAVAHGDFNCDGFQDLAIGVPEEDLLGGLTNAGQVTVVFGSETGLDPTTSIFLSQSLGNTHLGRSCDDLAIGVPGMSYTINGVGTVQGGAVIILPILANGNGFWYPARHSVSRQGTVRFCRPGARAASAPPSKPATASAASWQWETSIAATHPHSMT